MIIQPGVEEPSVAAMIELARTNSIRRVNIELRNIAGNLVDINATTPASGDAEGALDLEVTDLGNNALFSESYYPPEDSPSATERIKHPSAGKYYIDWGTEDDETEVPQRLLFNWHSRENASAEDVYRTQVVDIISPRVFSLLPSLRMMLDKVIKPNLPEKYCFLGYTDGMLVLFLRLGLNMINEAQPYPTWVSLEHFPIELFSNILIKAAIYQGVTSQLLFSIDTDVPQYSDSGHSFVLQHATPLAGYLSHLRQELDAAIPNFKRHFVNSGTMSAEVRMDMAFSMMLASAPYGSLFRNLWPGGVQGV